MAQWKGLKIPEDNHVHHFAISRYELVHQSQLDIFIQICCPNIQLQLDTGNYQLFLDNVFLLIQEYQEQLKKEFSLGKYTN